MWEEKFEAILWGGQRMPAETPGNLLGGAGAGAGLSKPRSGGGGAGSSAGRKIQGDGVQEGGDRRRLVPCWKSVTLPAVCSPQRVLEWIKTILRSARL